MNLSTNAAKYGAPSVPAGNIAVEWRQDGVSPQGDLILEWRENDGPPVDPPARKGFGSELIERAINYELNGKSTVEFAPSGVKIMVKVPLSEVGAVGSNEDRTPS